MRYPTTRDFSTLEEYQLALSEWESHSKTKKEFCAEREYKASRINEQQKYEEWKKRKEHKMVDFANGVKVKTVQTKYGEIIKIGINLDEFAKNPITDSGYINFDIKMSKKGNKYAEINNYKKEDNEEIPY